MENFEKERNDLKSESENKVSSLFCGAGGLDLGFENQGFKTLWANDLDKDACATHSLWSKAEVVCGDVTKIDFAETPDCDVLLGGFPCFAGETLVLTENGYERISEVKVGTKVLSHDGEYHKVTKAGPTGIKKIFELNPVGSDVIRTTENHLFYVRRRVADSPEWKSVREIMESKERFYVGCPLNNESRIPTLYDLIGNDFRNARMKYRIDLTSKTLWYLAGRYVGDGWLRRSAKKNRKINGVVIACGKHKLNGFLEKIGNDFHCVVSEERTAFKLHFVSAELGAFLSLFGENALKKKIPGFVTSLPKELLVEFLAGYFDADGHRKKENKVITTVSEELSYGTAQCVMKAYGVPCVVRKDKFKNRTVIEGRTVNQHDMYVVTWNEDENAKRKSFIENGWAWFPIHWAKPTEKEEIVYDLTVEDAHSFVACCSTVHNCQGFSLAGPRRIDDGRNVMYRQVTRFLETKNPKIFICENVKGLLTMADGQIAQAIVEDFRRRGYRVSYALVNAADYGVPQDRQRIIICGIREDLSGEFRMPEPFEEKKTLRDAIWDMPEAKPEDVCAESFSSRYMSRNRKRGWDERSFTIPAMAKQVALHPSSPDMVKLGRDEWEFGKDGITRRLSWRECAAIQTFPKDMEFVGNLTSRYRQIGNAVPVKLGEAAAKQVREILRENGIEW